MDMASKWTSSIGTLVSNLLWLTLNYTVSCPRCRSGSLFLRPKQDIGCSSCRQYVFTSSIDRSLTWSTNICFYLRDITQPSCTQHLAWPLVPPYLTFMKYNTRELNVLECETSNLGNVSFPYHPVWRNGCPVWMSQFVSTCCTFPWWMVLKTSSCWLILFFIPLSFLNSYASTFIPEYTNTESKISLPNWTRSFSSSYIRG